jgi:hypothetical protein
VFTFANVTYDRTLHGVLAIGDILRGGLQVGMFAQRPHHAYHLDFERASDRQAFLNHAVNKGMTEQELADSLLRQYEDARPLR